MTHPPGSQMAIANGCNCPILDNGHGAGSGHGAGCYWINYDCPIHGRKLTADDFRDGYEITDAHSDCTDMGKA